MTNNYGAGSSWVALGTYADSAGKSHFYGFPFKKDLKSLVWYLPEQFEDNGYEIPQSMEELIALSDQMVADGNTPWCIGVESGNATGLDRDRLDGRPDAAHGIAREVRPVGIERASVQQPAKC